MEIPGNFRGKPMQNDVSSTRQSIKADSSHSNKPPHVGGSESVNDLRGATLLSRLTAELQQTPEIREDVVSRVRENLASGQYLSKQAANETAAAILNIGQQQQ